MGGITPNPEAYKAFRVSRNVKADMYSDTPSLEKARCPKCHARVVITNVHETTVCEFDGTDVESGNAVLVRGKLVCPKVAAHTDSLPYGMSTVLVDGRMSSLVKVIGEIADEIGY